MSRSPRLAPVPNATHYGVLTLALLLLTVYGSIVPLRYRPVPYDVAVDRVLAAPLHDPTPTGARGDWTVNAVQYAALAFGCMGILSVDTGLGWMLVCAVVVAASISSLGAFLELVQVSFPPRTVSRSDLVVEAVGAFAGVVAWLAAGTSLTRWVRRFWGLRGRCGLALQLLPAYLILLFVVQLMPFDVAIGRDELERKWKDGRIALVPFETWFAGGSWMLIKAVVNVAAWIPVGMLMAWLPSRPSLSRSTVIVAALDATILLELMQLLVYSRQCDMTDVVTGTLGALGAWAFVRHIERSEALGSAWVSLRTALRDRDGGLTPLGRAAWILALVAWAAVLIGTHWWPMHFTTDPVRFARADAGLSDEDTSVFGLRRMSWAPVVDYYWGSRYQALDQFARRSLSFAPLGMLFALGTRRKATGTVAGGLAIVFALATATVIEVGQYFLPERHPSTTDLLIQVFGAGIGFVMTYHLRAEPACVELPEGYLSGPAPMSNVPQKGIPVEPEGARR